MHPRSCIPAHSAPYNLERPMPRLSLALLLTPAPPPLAQPAGLAAVAAAQRRVIRSRAMHSYKMPDGQIWDAWGLVEQRKIIDYNVKPFDRVEPGQAAPGQTLVEDKIVGTVWKVKP